MLTREVIMASLAAALLGGAPAVPPLPEVGFWLAGIVRQRNRAGLHPVVIEFADHTHAAYEPGDGFLGWTVADVRDNQASIGEIYVLLVPPDGNGVVELYCHIRPDARPNVARWHMKWSDWLHHCNQLDAVRYRAEGLIIVVGKPHGEPDDPDPSDPLSAYRPPDAKSGTQPRP